MFAARSSFRNEACRLKGLLHPRIAVMDSMFFLQLLVEVTDVEIRVLLPVQLQYLLQLCYRHPFRAWRLRPTIEQAVEASFFPFFAHAPDRPIRNSQNLGRLHPCELFAHCPENHFLYFHCSLHCRRRVLLHADLRLKPHSLADLKRTIHVSIRPDKSRINDTAPLAALSTAWPHGRTLCAQL